MTLETIKAEIRKPSRTELAEFRCWFIELDGEAWDAQMEADAAAGKLDALAEEAITEGVRK